MRSGVTKMPINVNQDSPLLGSGGDSITPTSANKWYMPGGKYVVLLRMILLLSLVTFLHGYVTASSHFMVNHLDTSFRSNEARIGNFPLRKQDMYLKKEFPQYDFSHYVLSSSIITNFHYVYTSDTSPQLEGRGLKSNINQYYGDYKYDHYYRTNGFSTFARGWIAFSTLGQAVGCGIAWKSTETIGRRQTLLCGAVSLLVLLCLHIVVSPDMDTFSEFTVVYPISDHTSTTNVPPKNIVVDISFSTMFYVLSWALRFVMGIPLGVILVTSILYASELPLPQSRGYYMSYLSLAHLAGVWSSLLITLIFHHHSDVSTFSILPHKSDWKTAKFELYSQAIHAVGNEWRWHIVIPLLCTIIVLIGFQSRTNWLILTPESPYWLLANDRTTLPTSTIASKSKEKHTINKSAESSDTSNKIFMDPTMDAQAALYLIRGGGKTSSAMREVTVEFSNMYRALAQDAVANQSWQDLCLGTSDISLRYRLLLVWILMSVQVLSGPFLFFELMRWFSLLLFGRDPYLAGDDDENAEGRYVFFQLSQSPMWRKFYPSDTYLFEGLLASCLLLSAMGGIFIGREFLDPLVVRAGYSHAQHTGRRSLLLTGLFFVVLFVICFDVTIHFHVWKYNDFITMKNLFWEYLIKYLCFGWLCFIALAYYASIGLTMWILPVEVWGLRYRSKCLCSTYVVYYVLLVAWYIMSFWIHKDVDTEKLLVHQALVAPSSLQRSLLEYAILMTCVGVYIFLALPETTGLMFEDSDELFSLEEYDVIGLCFPRGSGSGYLGFRTFEQVNLRFHIYFVASKTTRNSQIIQVSSQLSQQPPKLSTCSSAESGNTAGAHANTHCNQHKEHPPVPILHSDNQLSTIVSNSRDSNDSSLTSFASPQSFLLGGSMNIHQIRGNVPGYGSTLSTPNTVPPMIVRSSSADNQTLRQLLPDGSSPYIPEFDEEIDDDENVCFEHKYSTPLRSSQFQYLENSFDVEEATSIHASSLFHTEKAKSRRYFSGR